MECPPPRSRALALASVRKAKSGVSQPMRVMVLTATGQSLKSINHRCALQSAACNSVSWCMTSGLTFPHVLCFFFKFRSHARWNLQGTGIN